MRTDSPQTFITIFHFTRFTTNHPLPYIHYFTMQDTSNAASFDTLGTLMQREELHLCRDYLDQSSRNTLISANVRTMMVDWMYSVIDKLQYDRETVAIVSANPSHASRDIVDLFISFHFAHATFNTFSSHKGYTDNWSVPVQDKQCKLSVSSKSFSFSATRINCNVHRNQVKRALCTFK